MVDAVLAGTPGGAAAATPIISGIGCITFAGAAEHNWIGAVLLFSGLVLKAPEILRLIGLN